MVNARGRGAVWTGDDDLPFWKPRQYLDRVKFHTDLDYIRIVREIPLTLNLPAISSVTYGPEETFSYKLFDHGLGGFPFILGETVVNGERVAFTGSVPVQLCINYGGAEGWYARWLALGADATSVYIHEYDVFYYSNATYGSSFPALSLPITVYLTNELLDVDTPRQRVGEATLFTPNRVKFADGLWDTNNRYIRKVSNPANKTLNMARGPTIELNRWTSGVNTVAEWRWRANAATVIGGTTPGNLTHFAPPDGFNTPLDISLGGGPIPGNRNAFSARAGRITASGPGGRSMFDSDDGLFHVLDKVSGAVTIPAVTWGAGSSVNSTTDYVIGTVDPLCTDVVGSIKFTLNNYAAGMAYDRWHTMFGGSSAIWVVDGSNLAGSVSNGNTYEMCWYSILVQSGQVILRRRLYCSQNMQHSTYSILSHKIDVKLKAGLFT